MSEFESIIFVKIPSLKVTVEHRVRDYNVIYMICKCAKKRNNLYYFIN